MILHRNHTFAGVSAPMKPHAPLGASMSRPASTAPSSPPSRLAMARLVPCHPPLRGTRRRCLLLHGADVAAAVEGAGLTALVGEGSLAGEAGAAAAIPARVGRTGPTRAL